MRLARCHIPGCLDTAGRRGFMCVEHWALVPKGVQLRHVAACRALRQHNKGGTPPPSWPHETGTECIRVVLVLLWSHAFPVPEGCANGLPWQCCICPLCQQARAVAPIAYGWRRFVESRERG